MCATQGGKDTWCLELQEEERWGQDQAGQRGNDSEKTTASLKRRLATGWSGAAKPQVESASPLHDSSLLLKTAQFVAECAQMVTEGADASASVASLWLSKTRASVLSFEQTTSRIQYLQRTSSGARGARQRSSRPVESCIIVSNGQNVPLQRSQRTYELSGRVGELELSATAAVREPPEEQRWTVVHESHGGERARMLAGSQDRVAV